MIVVTVITAGATIIVALIARNGSVTAQRLLIQSQHTDTRIDATADRAADFEAKEAKYKRQVAAKNRVIRELRAALKACQEGQ